MSTQSTPEESKSLTKSMIDIIRLLSEGYTFDQIAAYRKCAVNTVKQLACRAYKRLGVYNSHGAVGEAYRRSILLVIPKLDVTEYHI